MARFTLLCMLLSALLLGGCGGQAVADDPLASPTAFGAPTATAIVVPTAIPLVPTTPEEAALLATVLTSGSLPDGWQLTSLSFHSEHSVEQRELCGLSAYPGWAEIVAEVEAEFGPAGGPGSLTQSVALLSHGRAQAAIQFIDAQHAGCNVWTGYQSRFTFVIEPFDLLIPAGNILAYHINFTVAGGEPVENQLVYIQVNDFITTITYGGPVDSNLDPLQRAVHDALARMEAAD